MDGKGEIWEVVGGADRGGIIVRAGPDLSSRQLPRRLATGALVARAELAGERLCFRKVAGEGPESGWVSVHLRDKALLVPAPDLPAANAPASPVPALVPAPAPAVPGALPTAPAAAPAAAATAPLPARTPPPHKRVWFVRHGEAEHNVLIDQGLPSSHLRDPGLSPRGIEQACSLPADPLLLSGALMPPGSEARAQRVVSSPCKRALQTAVQLARAAALPVLALPMLQECTDNPCDTGRPRAELEAEFPDVDFSALHDRWYEKVGSNRGDQGRDLLRQRCVRIKEWLVRSPEQRLVVVAHRTLFAYLLQLDFAPAEVIEMRLHPPTAGAGGSSGGIGGKAGREGRVACAGPAAGPNAWLWEEVRASAEIFDLYNWKDEPLCSQGSPPLRGTLNTCRVNRGEEAWRNTLKRAGWAPPLLIPGLC